MVVMSSIVLGWTLVRVCGTMYFHVLCCICIYVVILCLIYNKYICRCDDEIILRLLHVLPVFCFLVLITWLSTIPLANWPLTCVLIDITTFSRVFWSLCLEPSDRLVMQILDSCCWMLELVSCNVIGFILDRFVWVYRSYFFILQVWILRFYL